MKLYITLYVYIYISDEENHPGPVLRPPLASQVQVQAYPLGDRVQRCHIATLRARLAAEEQNGHVGPEETSGEGEYQGASSGQREQTNRELQRPGARPGGDHHTATLQGIHRAQEVESVQRS